MAILITAAILVCLLLLLVLYRNLPNKKVFYGFCIILAVTIGGIAHSLLLESSREPVNAETISRITAQQQIFDGWYTEYKKHLDDLDYNWAQSQMILRDYRNDDISLNTAYNRLSLLEHQAQAVSEALGKLTPPPSLEDTNYTLADALMAKTRAYAARQQAAITAAREAADPARLKTNDHLVQSHLMDEALLRNAPDALFTASETNSLRQNLTIPEN